MMRWLFLALLMIEQYTQVTSNTKTLCGDEKIKCLCQNTSAGVLVDCSGRGFPYVPNTLPPDTISLNMSHNALRTLPNNAFSYMTRLAGLDLYNTSLLNISERAFSGLVHLKYLNISFNPELPQTNRHVHKYVYEDLISLEELRMYATTATGWDGTYPDKALSYLGNLTSLYMDGMPGKMLGDGFRNLTNLKFLTMSGDYDSRGSRFCKLDLTNSSLFQNIKGITHLVIRACGINEVGSMFFRNFTDLENLDLSENKNLTIGKALKAADGLNFTNLSVLKLNHVIDTFKLECGQTLEKIDCKHIGKLGKLRELHIAHNLIVNVGKGGLKYLPKSLQFVDASNNEFQLHYYLLELSVLNLKRIDISFQYFPIMFLQKFAMSETVPALASENDRHANETVNTDPDLVNVSADINHHLNSRDEVNDMDVTDKDFDRLLNYFANMKAEPLDEHILNVMLGKNKRTGDNESSVCKHIPGVLPYGLITPYLPPYLEFIDISHSKLGTSIFNFTVSSNNSVLGINASRSMLYCWDGPFNGLEKLEFLDLSFNVATRVQRDFFDPFPNLRELNIALNVLSEDISNDVKGQLLKRLEKLEKLNIGFNRIEGLPKLFLKAQKNLKELNITGNYLQEFEIDIRHIKSLSLIDLSKNIITSLSPSMQNSLEDVASYKTNDKGLLIDLSHNILHCQCDDIDFIKWLSKHQKPPLTVLTTSCTDIHKNKRNISNLNQIDIVLSELSKECVSYFVLIIMLTVAFFVFLNILTAAMIYRFRWKLRYWYYVARNLKVRKRTTSNYLLLRYGEGETYKYHAFVHSLTESTADNAFFDKLEENLERKRHIKLCHPDRDFVPNQQTFSMVGNAIYSSRAAMFVVSRESLENREWVVAMNMALEVSSHRGYQVFFAVFLEDIPTDILFSKKNAEIGKLYRTKKFLFYPSSAGDEELETFWDECSEKIQRINILE